MDSENFIKKIKSELQKMSNENVVFFAWLCAVRALPYIGSAGHFNYWEKKDRKKHLYALFRALDASNYFIYTKISPDDIAAKAATISFSYAETTATAAATRDAVAATRDAVAAVVTAAIAATAADASSVAFAAADATTVAAATDATVDAATAIITASSVYTANKTFTDISLSDIKEIQNGSKISNNDLKCYGEVWDNFQIALKEEGCSYWGRLYQNIFAQSFELDRVALERRMNVPKEIQEEGAAAVETYLIQNVPKEIQEQGEAAVETYLAEMGKGATHLNEARIIILGEKGAGKTCLARRLINPNANMTTDNESTAGVDTSLWKLKHDDMNIHIWDFAGHTVTHAVHKFFLSERCLYILVYDARTEGRNRLDYWLSQMKNYGGKSKVFILVNKRDPHPPEIPINSLKDKYSIAGNYTLSIQDDKILLDHFRKDVIDYIKNNPSWSNQVIPANYFNVKKELEKRFIGDKKDEYINIDDFNQIAKENKINDSAELLKNLHALGICLRYEGMGNFDTLVLNPEWISHGIYRIINWVCKQGGHSISGTDFSVIFENDTVRYPEDKYPFLYELMIRYELAYETEKKDCLIIPHLLHEDRPDPLPDFPESESLMFLYQAKQPLPPNSISRFTVRHNKEIKKERKEFLVWRHGVVLEDENGSVALVREWENERKITIEVKGNDKTAYQDKLKETLNNIFGDIFKKNEGDKPELQYRIIRQEPIPDEREKPLPVDQILAHVKKNAPFLDPVTGQFIDLGLTAKSFNLFVFNNPTGFNVYNNKNMEVVDNSKTFNFYNCNIDLQGHLNDLAGLLKRKGEIEEAEVLEDAAEALSKAEQCKPGEVKKKGILNKLERIAMDLGDPNSKLYKKVGGIRYGIDIAKEIVKGCNAFAQCVFAASS